MEVLSQWNEAYPSEQWRDYGFVLQSMFCMEKDWQDEVSTRQDIRERVSDYGDHELAGDIGGGEEKDAASFFGVREQRRGDDDSHCYYMCYGYNMLLILRYP